MNRFQLFILCSTVITELATFKDEHIFNTIFVGGPTIMTGGVLI